MESRRLLEDEDEYALEDVLAVAATVVLVGIQVELARQTV